MKIHKFTIHTRIWITTDSIASIVRVHVYLLSVPSLAGGCYKRVKNIKFQIEKVFSIDVKSISISLLERFFTFPFPESVDRGWIMYYNNQTINKILRTMEFIYNLVKKPIYFSVHVAISEYTRIYIYSHPSQRLAIVFS